MYYIKTNGYVKEVRGCSQGVFFAERSYWWGAKTKSEQARSKQLARTTEFKVGVVVNEMIVKRKRDRSNCCNLIP